MVVLFRSPRRVAQRHYIVLVLLVATLAGACGGPREPLEVGVKSFPSDVILGSQNEPEEIPTFLPPDAMPRPTVVLTALPPVRTGYTTPTTASLPDPCPTVDPLASPRLEATNEVTRPPEEATYTYRNVGEIEVGGPDARKAQVPPQSTRTVQNVEVAEDTSFTHEVVSVLGDTVTTTAYRTIPVKAGGGSGGIFITSITTQTGDDEAQTFNPTPDLELLRFPIEVGLNWKSSGADPSAGVTMFFNATVRTKARVDACGTVLDAQTVDLDGNVAPCATPPAPPPGVPIPPGDEQCPPPQPGVTISDDGGSRFTATYMIGTQFGGLALSEETVVDSTQDGVGVHREMLSTISREPEVASP